MQKEVGEKLSTNFVKAIECQNDKTHVVSRRPTVRDFVVLAQKHEQRTKMGFEHPIGLHR